MVDNAHIYNPQDDSLTERIRAYRVVHQDYLNAEASLKFSDDDTWADTLGSREEVSQAHKIGIHSLQIATEAIKRKELVQAKEEGLLSKDEVDEIIENKQQYKMQRIRKGQQTSKKFKYSHKP